MPVAPMTAYYPSRSTSYYRSTPSTSSLLSRTTSLDRSSYSSYSPSSYGVGSYTPSYSSSSYTSKYSSSSRPPRPSYSSSYGASSSDSYSSRTRGIRETSPGRHSYTSTTRNTSESRDSEERTTKIRQDSATRTLGARSISDTSSRYASSTISSRLRDSSNSRDSGYGSRLASRDRSLDIKNGNSSIDTKAYGPSASSYASNYRWEGRNKNKEKQVDKETEEETTIERPKVSDRIRNFESFDDDSLSSLASRVERTSINEEAVARRKRDEDNLAARRQRLGLSPIRKSRSRTPEYSSHKASSSYRKQSSPERNGNLDDEEGLERRPSVTELRRKYDTSNHNGYASTGKEDDDTDEAYASSSGTSYRETPTIRCDAAPSTSSHSRRRTDSDNYSRESPTSSYKATSDYSSGRRTSPDSDRDSSSLNLRDSNRLESPSLRRKALSSPQSRSPDGRKSPLTNGTATTKQSLQHLDDPSCSSQSPSSYTPSSYSSLYGSGSSYYAGRVGGDRRDRVRERIAARVARELDEEDDSGQQRSACSGGGGFSKNSGLVGLRNIGNTCFLNSVTQCLSNTRCLLEYIVKEGYTTDINTSSLSTMKGDLIRAFGNLISEMWTEGDSNRALNTGPFKTQIQKFAPAFTGYQQHDAQEFLRKLLEGLHEDVNRVTTKPRPILSDIDEDLSDDQKAMESWKRYLRYDDSKIVDMFVGQLKSSLQCSHCSHTSVTFDPFWDLSLPIPNKSGTVRLNQCLELFTKEEVMDGDERPTCSKCKERRKMTKSFNIQRFPRVLVLHLKRFSPTERWRGKLSCTIEFPLENLDLSRHASSSRSSCNYNLIGVANHSGTTYSGHYTAFCRHPYSSEWHEYNDSRVSSIAARRVCSPEAYVLFYELSKL